MEKESSAHIICLRCSNEVREGERLCPKCQAMEKQADKKTRSLREAVYNSDKEEL